MWWHVNPWTHHPTKIKEIGVNVFLMFLSIGVKVSVLTKVILVELNMLLNTFIVFVCFRICIAIAPLRSLYRGCQSTTPYFAFYWLSILTAWLCLNSLVSWSSGWQKVTTTELAWLLHTHTAHILTNLI